ncbi:hypothetical protein K7432_012623 [Basidiobolus ranarum]|uniref:O-fucosyltransferase family protein n=1 Tax=Basidiobolus ranarum TaxID=34480 RepID=A0ABR2VRZ9_9FUNG
MMYQYIKRSIISIRHWSVQLSNPFTSHKWTLLESQEEHHSGKQLHLCLRRRNIVIGLLVILYCVALGAYLLRFKYFRPRDWVTGARNPLIGEPWFVSKEVLAFRKSYPPQEYNINTPSLTYILEGCSAGFGSYMNNLFNLFLVALDNDLSFHIISLDWCYVSWSTFFQDYTSNSPAPIGLGEYHGAHKWWNTPEWELTDVNSTSFKGHITVHHRKKIVAQALWEPKPLIKDVILKIQKLYVEGPNKVFISMHIRRGDKLWYEAKELPIKLYSDKVKSLADSKYSGRDISLFVLSDDDKSVAALRALLLDNPKIRVFTLADAFSQHPDLTKDWKPLEQRVGYDQDNFIQADKEYQYSQTAESIADITLAATADEFICTFSSNIGRLITILRTQPIDTVHSMDWPEWRMN